MSQLRSFAPWIVYPIASALFGWQAGAAVALGFCIVGLAPRRPCRRHRHLPHGRARVLRRVDVRSRTPIRPAVLHRYVPALIPATLAVAAAMSIVVARPFTVAFAKRVAPREFWDTPLFVHINVVLTGVWATSFAITAAIIAITLTVAPHAVGILIGAQVAGFVVPMRITRYHRPSRARSPGRDRCAGRRFSWATAFSGYGRVGIERGADHRGLLPGRRQSCRGIRALRFLGCSYPLRRQRARERSAGGRRQRRASPR